RSGSTPGERSPSWVVSPPPPKQAALAGHDEVDRQQQVQAEAGRGRDEGQGEGKKVSRWAPAVAGGDDLCQAGVAVACTEQPAIAGGISPEQVEKDRDQEEPAAVNGCRHVLIGRQHVLGDDVGGEGDYRDTQE